MLRSTFLGCVLGIGLLPFGAVAESFSGAYLAGRQANRAHDFDVAARYFVRALRFQPDNAQIMAAAALARIQEGTFDRAVPIAERLAARGQRSQIANLILTTDLARQGNFEALVARAGDEDAEVGPLVDGLVLAWAHVGAGDLDAARVEFDRAGENTGLRGFALYHQALALALSGDFEGAEAIFAADTERLMQSTRRGAMARAEILSQLGRNTDALATLDLAFGSASDPGIAALRAKLEAGAPVPFTHVTSVRDGMAEVFYSVAAALSSDAQPDYALIYIRAAQALRPDHTDALLLGAELLGELEQYELALQTYGQVPVGDVDFHAAELGRVSSLRKLGKPDAALEVLHQLSKSHDHLAIVHSTKGDILRQQDDFARAALAYDAALTRTPTGARTEWFLQYARAISFEREGEWEKAEAGFRRALELSPGQPQVLNYLGYSLVEKQIKLDEALDMIERAVEARPDSGYIVDSLGWVLFRLGRYQEAVAHMERAVELMAVDPVVNDHLGDVYWAVGRYREAEFQWSRALSFIDEDDNDSEADPARIRRKLSVGLDAVLAEEGAKPLTVAHDN